jgi:hypothetical protein
MHISADLDRLVKQLEDHYRETVRKLENMVRGWAYEVTLTAIGNTPIGDNSPEPVGNLASYLRRQQEYGFLPEPGLARSGWQAKPNGNLTFQQHYDPDIALSGVKGSMAGYQLGQDVWIGNKGPYIRLLEENFSSQTNGDGILKPTLQSIQALYQSDFTKYYK